jgi:signal transduction histidine kinase
VRDRPYLVRPLSWDRGALEAALSGLCAAALVAVFFGQLGAGDLATLAPIPVVPVLAAAWLGSTRVSVGAVALSVALDLVLAVHGNLDVPTALTRSVVMVGLGILTRLAATGYAGTRSGAARLALVSRVSRIATSASSLDDILRSVLDEMARDGLRGGVILLLDEHHQLYIAAAHGDLDDSVRNSRLDVGEGIHGRVVATARSVIVDDLDDPATGAANRNLGSNARMRSLVAVPLLAAGTSIGVLSVDAARPGAFDAGDLAMLEQIAVAIAGSVQRAGALQLADRMLQQRVDELTLLLDTAGRLAMSLDTEVVMHEVVRSTAAVVSHGGAQMRARAAVFRVSEGWARLVAVEDADELADVPADLPLDEHHFIREAVTSGTVVTGRLEQTGPSVAAAAARLGLVSGAWAPIWTGKSLYGVLAATSRDERAFDGEELRLLEGIAHLAGLAIGNAESLRLERERAAAAREHAERMASVERVKSEFLRLASHELRGPLGVLGGYVSMMEEGSLGSDQLRRVLPVLSGKIAEMNRLVDQMLETARLEEGRLRLDNERLDLGRVLAEAVRTVLPMGAPRHDVVVDARGSIPVVGDAARVLTVLANLVGNAIKYSPHGGQVRCTACVEDGRAVARIADEGIGIAAEDLPRLFTRFGRVVTSENSHIAGTGLGLYLARELARMHGGDITVSSRLGAGSTFTFTMPLAAHVVASRDDDESEADDLPEAAEQ